MEGGRKKPVITSRDDADPPSLDALLAELQTPLTSSLLDQLNRCDLCGVVVNEVSDSNPPVLLPCAHMACAGCQQKILSWATENKVEEFDCPVESCDANVACRPIFTLPECIPAFSVKLAKDTTFTSHPVTLCYEERFGKYHLATHICNDCPMPRPLCDSAAAMHADDTGHRVVNTVTTTTATPVGGPGAPPGADTDWNTDWLDSLLMQASTSRTCKLGGLSSLQQMLRSKLESIPDISWMVSWGNAKSSIAEEAKQFESVLSVHGEIEKITSWKNEMIGLITEAANYQMKELIMVALTSQRRFLANKRRNVNVLATAAQLKSELCQNTNEPEDGKNNAQGDVDSSTVRSVAESVLSKPFVSSSEAVRVTRLIHTLMALSPLQPTPGASPSVKSPPTISGKSLRMMNQIRDTLMTLGQPMGMRKIPLISARPSLELEAIQTDELIQAISLDSSGRYVATGHHHGFVQVHDLVTNKLVPTVNDREEVEGKEKSVGHKQLVLKVTWHPTEPFTFISVSVDGSVRLWRAVFAGDGSVEEFVCKKTLIKHSDKAFNEAIFNPNGSAFAVVGEPCKLQVYSYPDGTLMYESSGHDQCVYTVDWSSCGKYIATSGPDSKVIVYDAATGNVLSNRTDHAATVRSVVFSPDNKLLCSIGFDNMVYMYSTDNWSVLGR